MPPTPTPAPGFRAFWSYSTLTNLQDGIMAAAGPLVVASIDRSPGAIAGAVVAQQSPALLFSLVAGALADRLSRRMLALVGNGVRILGLAVLALAALGGWLSLPLVYAVLFVLGTSECFADNSARTILPLIVPKKDLGTANAKLMGVSMSMQRMVGPLIGAWLFALGMTVPYAASALLLAAAVLCFARIPLPAHVPPPTSGAHPLRQIVVDIKEGARYTWRNVPVRTLVLLIFLMNISYGAMHAMLVLVATEHMGLGAAGYGWLMTALGVGSLAGIWVYPRYERVASAATMLRVGLVFEVLTHLFLVVARGEWVILPWFAVFGAHEMIWGSVSIAVRQKTVPQQYMGRVMSVYGLGIFGGAVIGAGLGGLTGTLVGWENVFWVTFVLAAAALAWVWGRLPAIAHSDDDDDAPA